MSLKGGPRNNKSYPLRELVTTPLNLWKSAEITYSRTWWHLSSILEQVGGTDSSSRSPTRSWSECPHLGPGLTPGLSTGLSNHRENITQLRTSSLDSSLSISPYRPYESFSIHDSLFGDWGQCQNLATILYSESIQELLYSTTLQDQGIFTTGEMVQGRGWTSAKEGEKVIREFKGQQKGEYQHKLWSMEWLWGDFRLRMKF